jgi:hypothetical protein
LEVEDERGCAAQGEDEVEVADEKGVKLVWSKEETMSGLPHSAPHFKRFLNSAFSTGRLFIIMDQIISSMMLS